MSDGVRDRAEAGGETPLSPAALASAEPDAALDVFISYSRRDGAFAERLRDRLIAAGFQAYLDKHDIAPGEDWRTRLGGLIEAADTVVFVISPDSIASSVCDWEVNHAELRAKRILPLVCRDPDSDTVPPRLGRLNYLFMRSEAEERSEFGKLKDALAVDIAWIRQHTRYGELADEWDRAGRHSRLLLRGSSIGEAERWRDSRPPTAPEFTEQHLAFIAASRHAATRRQRITVAGSLAATVMAVALSGAAVWFGLEANNQTQIAQESEAVATENETVGLAALSRVALAEGRPADAVKLALAAWPRAGDGDRPMLERSMEALAATLPEHRERVRLRGHEQAAVSIAYSPDGTRLATGSEDGTTRIWSTVSGEEVVRLPRQEYTIFSVAFSPDGAVLATGSSDGLRLWNSETGGYLKNLSNEARGSLSVAFSPDGKHIAGAMGGVVRIWDALTGKVLQTLPEMPGIVASIAYAPDGMRLAGASDGDLWVWDVSARMQLFVLEGTGEPLHSVAFAPNGMIIATGGQDGMVRLRDASDGAEVWASEHDDDVASVAFSPDGARVASASWDDTARVFDTETGNELLVLREKGHGPADIAFSPDGRLVATAGSDATASIWDTTTGREFDEFGKLTAVAFSPDGALTAGSGQDGRLRIWNTADVGEVRTLDAGVAAVSIAFLPDGTGLASAATDGAVRVLDLEGHTLRIDRAGRDTDINSLAVSSDGQRLGTTSTGGAARAWALSTGTELLVRPGTEDAPWVHFSPDIKRLALGWMDGRVSVMDVPTGEEIFGAVEHQSSVTSVVFSRDGKRLLTTADDDTARVWDATTGEVKLVLRGHENSVAAAAFSEDQTLVATASGSPLDTPDNTVRIWDATNGSQRIIMRGHSAPVSSVAFSPDGQRVASAAEDGSARLWDIATGVELLSLSGEDKVMTDVTFSPDGKRLATASSDGFSRIWDISDLETGDAFQIACKRLGNNTSLDDVREKYGLGELTPICGDNPPLPVDWSKLH